MEIIAEIGWNFLGDMDLAKQMIKKAKESGANIVKFQYWSEKKLKPGAWDNDGRREIYKAAELSAPDIKELMETCSKENIEFLISSFNAEDARFLKSLGVEKMKIPSHEIANVELHDFCATNFKKSYVSLGAGSFDEIKKTVEIYNSVNASWVGMHCVSSYPCPMESVNLPKLKSLSKLVPILGFSDHTSETITPALALPFGVEVIEKHFTSDNNLPGRDNQFALNPENFREMVGSIYTAEKALSDRGLEASELETDTINNYRGRWG